MTPDVRELFRLDDREAAKTADAIRKTREAINRVVAGDMLVPVTTDVLNALLGLAALPSLVRGSYDEPGVYGRVFEARVRLPERVLRARTLISRQMLDRSYDERLMEHAERKVRREIGDALLVGLGWPAP